MKRNALLIGTFVIAALAMVVAAVLWLSGATLFSTQQQVMIYYPGNVSGLYVGAPVTFRGVAVGQVEEIGIEVDHETLKARIPVRVRLQGEALQLDGSQDASIDVPALVERGLRARLVAQSFVTGQKSIELDFVPDTPSALLGDGRLPEIPALADRFGALIDQVADLPLRETVKEIRDTVKELRGTLVGMQKALDGAQSVLASTASELSQTGAEARRTLQVASEAIRQVQQSSSVTLASITELAQASHDTVVAARPELQNTLTSAREAAESARLAMSRVAEMTAPGAPLRGDLEAAVRDLSQAARGLRDWAELLEEQPNAVIFGNRRP